MRSASIVLLAVVGMSSVAAPVPKKAAIADYFPCAVGSMWEYAAAGEKEASVVLEVKASEEKDGERLVTFEHVKAVKTVSGVQVYRVNADGVAVVSDRGSEVSPPRLEQRAAPKANDEWECPHTWIGAKYGLTVTVGEEEKVKLPAGEFTALPHTMTYTVGVRTHVYKAWIAPGVGQVKFTSYDGTTYELLKYTAGKEK
jgi:hypothetical protein